MAQLPPFQQFHQNASGTSGLGYYRVASDGIDPRMGLPAGAVAGLGSISTYGYALGILAVAAVGYYLLRRSR